ncbi:MAG: hypothetical protein GY778_15420, partial [bacterium]|nr:hypothetical protein [bacterium]
MAKRAHHDDPREEPPIRELEIEAGNERSDLRASAPKPGSGAVIVVLVAAVAAIVGITYGFLLGRGDRELVSQTSVAGTTTTTRFTPTTAVPVVGEIRVQFVRTAPGRDLGIGVTEYLNANLFTTLTADSDGIIWAGGNSGVVRLDPATGEFTKLTDTDGTGPVNVISIAAAPDGSVWVTSDRGLSHWREGAWTDDSRFSSAGGTERWPGALALGDDGTVWLATHQWGSGGERAQIHHSRAPFLGDIPTSTFDHFVQAIEIDQEGRVWILTNRRLWQFDGEWHPTLEPGPRWFHAMAADAAGVLWFGAEDRIFRWDGDDLSERFWGAPTPDPADPM